ncbi:MAG: hypothetical protein SFW67_28630 [Myxococcaceae bacterium]|nr:hypothetical protein [Myxococcaceae bacterium]
MKPLSSWTNFQDIFKANAGEGSRMNEDVYGSLEREGEAARSRLKNAEEGFNRRSGRAASEAFQGLDQNTAAGAEASGKRTYAGPRTLAEYDPELGNVFADASRRIGASAYQQLATRYGKGLSAGGSSFDLALMGGAGGNDRRARLQKTYGSLGDELGAAQQSTDARGQEYADAVRQEALRRAGRAPSLRQAEAAAARRKLEADIEAGNNKAREDYDREWQARTDRLRRAGLQAAYQPPESETVPFYPAS